jgi:hypothetical protein
MSQGAAQNFAEKFLAWLKQPEVSSDPDRVTGQPVVCLTVSGGYVNRRTAIPE